ncbi:MAG: hypothetical protein Q4P78_08260 [Rothia sp. (in: high G+C Gram-positive bacteria)]|uniref:hypothetical protein n=1 Tax=Rothia sp. (in: high G+C Gram-positive bacteria) TaxID=1885016 RepID=UPI0026DF2326|nr:hypothetical protein [Rothia sp. (in: high G+C Gram-positive bacteria)]MDO5751169.1 hypothetical protein [Rothia sp. (in: high G+C Gram-positive bacteria)]
MSSALHSSDTANSASRNEDTNHASRASGSVLPQRSGTQNSAARKNLHASDSTAHPHGSAVSAEILQEQSEPTPAKRKNPVLRIVLGLLAFAISYFVVRGAVTAAFPTAPSEGDMRGSFSAVVSANGSEVMMNLELNTGGQCTVSVHSAGVSSPANICTWSMTDKRISVTIKGDSGSQDLGELNVESKDRLVSRDAQTSEEIIFKRR